MTEKLPIHPKSTNCPKCNSTELEVRYFMPDGIIASCKECLDCHYTFYDGTFGEDEWEEDDTISDMPSIPTESPEEEEYRK